MYRLAAGIKKDPVRRWALPDRVFLACGACHILAHAFLVRYPGFADQILWIRPGTGFTGNHIVVASDKGWVFDYHGYSERNAFMAHTFGKARRWWPGWYATLVELPPDVLISEPKSKSVEGLWLMEPSQFLHGPLPRALTYLKRFPAPDRHSP